VTWFQSSVVNDVFSIVSVLSAPLSISSSMIITTYQPTKVPGIYLPATVLYRRYRCACLGVLTAQERDFPFCRFPLPRGRRVRVRLGLGLGLGVRIRV